jgi:exodeoxyribonuclease (lambda-induced)
LITFDTSAQGTPAWLQARKGRITGSRFKDARDRTAKGALSSKATLYALDTARERFGGTVAPTYTSAAMRTGTEQEPIARMQYEAETGNVVLEAGFAFTDDGRFGASVDGLVGADGMVEIKTMVSSDTLFTAVVHQDYSAYIDQINGSLWLLDRNWCDLILWAPDLPIGALTIIRIERDEAAIKKLAADLLAFDATVEGYFKELSDRLKPAQWTDEGADTLPPEPVETVDRDDALTQMEDAPRKAVPLLQPTF